MNLEGLRSADGDTEDIGLSDRQQAAHGRIMQQLEARGRLPEDYGAEYEDDSGGFDDVESYEPVQKHV